MNYPAAYQMVNIGGEDQWTVVVGATFTTTFDSVQRPIKIMDDYVQPRERVKDVIYGPAGEITQIKYPQSYGNQTVMPLMTLALEMAQ